MPLLKAFSVEKIKLQHKALKSERLRTEIYFSKHKCAVGIEEKGHTDRNQGKENERQTKIEKHSDCKCFCRINPDAEDSDIVFEISKIPGYIAQSNKEKIKELENIITDQEVKIKNKKTK